MTPVRIETGCESDGLFVSAWLGMETGPDWSFRPHHSLERSRTSHPQEQILPGDGSEGERRWRGGSVRRQLGFAAERRRLGREVTTAQPPSRWWSPRSPPFVLLFSPSSRVLGSCRAGAIGRLLHGSLASVLASWKNCRHHGTPPPSPPHAAE